MIIWLAFKSKKKDLKEFRILNPVWLDLKQKKMSGCGQ